MADNDRNRQTEAERDRQRERLTERPIDRPINRVKVTVWLSVCILSRPCFLLLYRQGLEVVGTVSQ